MVANVSRQGSGSTEYGILIYDIPQENMKLYDRIQSKIRRKAIRLNLSVYLCLWGMRDELEKIIDDAQEETGQYASVFFAKFDNSEESAIRRAAKESLIVEMKRIAKRLVENVRKTREKLEAEGREFKHISEGYARKIQHRLEEAEALAMLFGLTRDTKYAMEAVQKSFAAEMDKILAEKQAKKAEKKAVREAKKAEEKRKRQEERERIRAEKAAAKAAEKEERKRKREEERERKKAEKAAQKEAEKARKKAERELKKAQRSAERVVVDAPQEVPELDPPPTALIDTAVDTVEVEEEPDSRTQQEETPQPETAVVSVPSSWTDPV